MKVKEEKTKEQKGNLKVELSIYPYQSGHMCSNVNQVATMASRVKQQPLRAHLVESDPQLN